MKNSNQLVVIVLCVVLLSNLFVLRSIHQAKNDIVSLRGDISRVRNETQHSINNVGSMVRGIVNDIREESRWVTPVEISLGEKKQDRQEITLTWQVKEHTQGSEVFLYYRRAESRQFEKIPAENIAGGAFSADIEIAIDFEPAFLVERAYTGKDSRGITNEEKAKEGWLTSQLVYEYYIEVQDGNRIKSSERDRFNLEGLRHLEFARIRVHIVQGDNGSHSFSVYEETSYDNSRTKLEKVFLKVGAAGREPLNIDTFQQGETIFTKTVNLDDSSARVELILEYDNGTTITKDMSHF